jgi:hypothetical protein
LAFEFFEDSLVAGIGGCDPFCEVADAAGVAVAEEAVVATDRDSGTDFSSKNLLHNHFGHFFYLSAEKS